MNENIFAGSLSKEEIGLVLGGTQGVCPDGMCNKKDKFVALDEQDCGCENKCRNCFNLKFNQGFYCDV